MPPPAPRRLRVALNHLTSGCAATTAPIASKANLKGTPPKGPGPAPVVFDKELPGCRGVDLSPEEIEHFKEHGWIVKKVTELLGAEDDVLVSYITNILEGEEPFPSGYKVRPRSSFEYLERPLIPLPPSPDHFSLATTPPSPSCRTLGDGTVAAYNVRLGSLGPTSVPSHLVAAAA